MPDVVVAGHLCVDVIPRFSMQPEIAPGQLREVGPLQVQPGGCVANAGLALAHLGTEVALVADAGADHLGRLLVSLLTTERVDATGVVLVSRATTSYSVVIQGPGSDRAFWHHAGANGQFDGARIDTAGARALHLGYPALLPSLCRGVGHDLGALFARERRRAVTTSLDLSTLDPSNEGPIPDWRAWFRCVLRDTDLFCPSLQDLNSALGSVYGLQASDVEDLAAEMLGLGPALVMIKAGQNGLHVRTASRQRLLDAGGAMAPLADRWHSRSQWMPPLRVDVAGTTGAGDAAVAGLIHALLAGLDFDQGLAAAAAAAASRIESGGAVRPWPELKDRLARGWATADAGSSRGRP